MKPTERTEHARKLVALMATRVALVTLTLGAVVLVHVLGQREAELGGPFGWFVSGLLIFVYLASIGYAIALPRVRNTVRFGALQLVGDIAIVTALVHVTGGAESGFASMYILVVVAANALGLSRRGAVLAMIASVASYVAVSVAGYVGLLPAVIGQPFLPWETTPQAVTRAILLNAVAVGAVALLSGNLAEQARTAARRAAADRATALDMAALAQDIVRSLSSGLVTVDDLGIIVNVNAEAEKILAGSRQNLLGRPLAELAPQMAPWLERAATGPVRRTEIELERAGDLLHLGVSISPLTDGTSQVRGRVVNFSDLTELKRKDMELKQKDRLAAIGQLAAGVAHEIRNPLAAISGSIELLAATPQANQENATLMAIVLREVDRLNGMISELLAYARPRSPELQAVDLSALLGETIQVFSQDRSQPTTKLSFASEPPLLARVDPSQIRQVAWNLLRNGAEAMYGGGEMRVRLLRGTDRVGFEVTDEGCGIAPADLVHVFDPFFTTKDGGTGLGLATVHRVVEDHGGRVELASTVGRGTRVRIWLRPAESDPSPGDAGNRDVPY